MVGKSQTFYFEVSKNISRRVPNSVKSAAEGEPVDR